MKAYPRPYAQADFVVNVPDLQAYWNSKREEAAAPNDWQEADDVILLLETLTAVFRGESIKGNVQCAVCKKWAYGNEVVHDRTCDGRFFGFLPAAPSPPTEETP